MLHDKTPDFLSSRDVFQSELVTAEEEEDVPKLRQLDFSEGLKEMSQQLWVTTMRWISPGQMQQSALPIASRTCPSNTQNDVATDNLSHLLA